MKSAAQIETDNAVSEERWNCIFDAAREQWQREQLVPFFEQVLKAIDAITVPSDRST